jgi:DNA-binding response OmpR family regulator
MRKFNLLLADNDPTALAIYAEFLESLGYHVLLADSPAQARRILETHRVHLAVLDLRLTDNDDSKDRSGLVLAKESSRSIPKLILTKFPTFQDVREALKIDERSLPPAIDFLNKYDDLEAIGDAINAAFAKHVRINLDLVIKINSNNVTFTNLVSLVEPGLEGEVLLSHVEELEDLFRQLFYEKSQMTADRLLWQQGGRVALKVFTFAEGKAPEALVMVCGQRAKVQEEERRYQEYAPKAPGHNGTVLSKSATTPNYAANSYALAETNLEDVSSLKELYHSASDKSFKAALTHLFERTLAEWHQGALIPREGMALDETYRTQLGLPAGRVAGRDFEELVRSIVKLIPTLGVEAVLSADNLMLRFGGQVFNYPNPASVLSQSLGHSKPVLLIKSPGNLSGDNILADSTGRTWLTDFAGAGLNPVCWNFTALEAAIRFDWVEANRLQSYHEMEQYLSGTDFSLQIAGEIELSLRKPARAIRLIRRQALRVVNKDYFPYNLGLLFQAASRIAAYDPSLQLTVNELARLAHLVVALAMIYGRILQEPIGGAKKLPQERATGIRIDKEDKTVWVNGTRIHLRGQSYELLYELYLHANEVCPRRTLIERVFGEKYDKFDESQINRLNTAIRRLREKIEDDPTRPQFLITELHDGYRLVTNLAAS